MFAELEIDVNELIRGLGFRLRPRYLRREALEILSRVRRIYPGRSFSESDRVPSSTYYFWLQACSTLPKRVLTHDELATLISLIVHMDAGGTVKTFQEILIERERDAYQNRTDTEPKTIDTTAQRVC